MPPAAPPAVPPGYVALPRSGRRQRPGAQRVGAADGATPITVTVRLRRRPGGPPLPEPDRWAALPIAERPMFTREQFARDFGAAPDDVALIRRFALEHGLAVGAVNLARRTVQLHGSVRSMGAAFAVELSRQRAADGREFRGREHDLHVPEYLREVVLGVFGLDDRPMARRGAPASAESSALTPVQVAAFYDYPTPPTADGQTVGLIEFEGGYRTDSQGRPTDIDAYFAGLGRTSPKLTPVSVDGGTNDPQPGPDSADGEVVLDICVAGAVAPGATIAVYFAPWTEQGWLDVLNAAIHPASGEPAPSVLSISYGWPELDGSAGIAWTAAILEEISQTFYEASLLGVTIFVASGDHGSSCGEADGRAHVSYPGSDPWITSCGGTRIAAAGAGGFSETTWDDANGNGETSSATGGGISDVFPLPAWQNGVGVPPSANPGGRVGRGLPDISGNASPASGYVLDVDGADQQVGGTSAVAPLYAGLLALINARRGKPVGFLNPTLYALRNTPTIRNIADGASNATGGAPGYTAVAGWNGCTGLGVVDGAALLQRLVSGG